MDWILISADLEFISDAVLPDKVSDHRPVGAEIGMTYFKEPASTMKIISILIIVVGVIMLNVSERLSNSL